MGKCTAVDVGKGCLRHIQGRCDLCGDYCYPSEEACLVLTCLSVQCKEVSDGVYHQACTEKYLRSIKIPTDRNTGFSCPRGRAKPTAFHEPCKGKVDTTPCIAMKSDKKPKVKPAPLPQPPQQQRGAQQQRQAKPGPPQPKAKKPTGLARKPAVGGRAGAGQLSLGPAPM